MLIHSACVNKYDWLKRLKNGIGHPVNRKFCTEEENKRFKDKNAKISP
jgi:hypothetical protein